MTLKVEQNERERSGVPEMTLGQVMSDVRQFLDDEAGFAQVYTINKAGFPVGRTMVAVVDDDWSVVLIQRKVHRRIAQIRRNPKMEILWSGSPSPQSINDRPHVYDFGLAIPRVVFIRGTAEFLDDDQLYATYATQTAKQLAKGLRGAPERTRENVLEELVGVVVRPTQVRVEGFGVGAQSFTWEVGAS